MVRARREQCGAALFGSSCFVQQRGGVGGVHPPAFGSTPQAWARGVLTNLYDSMASPAVQPRAARAKARRATTRFIFFCHGRCRQTQLHLKQYKGKNALMAQPGGSGLAQGAADQTQLFPSSAALGSGLGQPMPDKGAKGDENTGGGRLGRPSKLYCQAPSAQSSKAAGQTLRQP